MVKHRDKFISGSPEVHRLTVLLYPGYGVPNILIFHGRFNYALRWYFILSVLGGIVLLGEAGADILEITSHLTPCTVSFAALALFG